MAARKNRIRVDPKTIEKIRTTQLVKRLEDHVLGTVDMIPSQVTAALGLIKKVLPDQAAVTQEISGPGGNPIDMKWIIEIVDAQDTNT